MPTARRHLAAGAVNGVLYAVGGISSGSVYRNTVEAYDPTTNAWTTKASMPTARAGLGVGVVNGVLYAVGGVSSGGAYLNTVEAYNPATNMWTTKASMPTARYGLGVGVVNGVIYAVGGISNGNVYHNTVEAYDPATNTWTTKASMPTARYDLGVGVVNGVLYAVGGFAGMSLGTVEAYDPVTNTWTTKASMPAARSQHGVGVVNGVLYAAGGGNASNTNLTTVDAYYAVTDTWTTKGQMPMHLDSYGAATVNGSFYAVGGDNSFGTITTAVEAFSPVSPNRQCREGDLTGDGKIDFWCYQSDGNWDVNLMNAGVSDLLVGISNGIGGNTTVTYKPSSADWTSTDSGWNLPFVTQNVASLTTCDNYNGTDCVTGANVSTTNYNYMGAYYNAIDREFRNYSYVKATNAVNNSTTETWFHQGNGTSASPDSGSDSPGYTAGLPYRTIVKDSGGVVRSQQDTLYAADSDGIAPYFTPVEQEDNWVCDAPGTCKQTRSVLTFDHTNGNLTRDDQHGDLSVTTDDRTATKSYSPNTTVWILGLPSSEVIYQGIGTTNQVARTDFYYDQVIDCNTASTNQTPTKGDLTRTVRWLSGGTSPATQMAYDSYGNLICAKDPNGNTTTLTYDTSSTFQKVITNALGHQTMTQYYGVDGVTADTGLYGQVKSVTNSNGEVTTTTYDVFGRKSQITYPNTLVKTFNYPCTTSTGCTPDATNVFGNVGSQYTKESGGGVSSWVYFDGLGRTITEKTTGPGTSIVRVDTDYNNLGQLSHKTLPYFDGGASNGSVTYSYDEIGRTKQITNADNSRTLLCYSLWTTATIDASNHMRRETKDAFGRLLQVDEYAGTHSVCPTEYPTAYATTTYQYDILGNLRFVTDAKANQTEMRYDTLSRKVFMHDPDMGNWIYEYDNVGNLIRQTDARGGAITFTYDALNRVKTKTATTSSPPTAPSNLTASLSGTQVNLTWTTSSSSVGVDHYEVWRSLNNGAYTLIANPTSANFSDTAVSSGSTYLYRVRAVDVAMNSSSYSNADYVTLFTDHPLVAGTTLVKAQHLTELRQTVNAVRAAAGLAAAAWTDATLSGIFIKTVHILELRDHLAPALSALGLTAPTYTDPTLTTGSTFVKKVHIEELRQAVQ
jgi:YD repeat-containing protein